MAARPRAGETREREDRRIVDRGIVLPRGRRTNIAWTSVVHTVLNM
jgi:hypothetical protein